MKTILAYTEKDGTDQTAHLHSLMLIKTFGVLLQILQNISTKNKDPYRVVRLRWLRWIFIVRPEDIFSHGTSRRERESIKLANIGIISEYIENARTVCPETAQQLHLFD